MDTIRENKEARRKMWQERAEQHAKHYGTPVAQVLSGFESRYQQWEKDLAAVAEKHGVLPSQINKLVYFDQCIEPREVTWKSLLEWSEGLDFANARLSLEMAQAKETEVTAAPSNFERNTVTAYCAIAKFVIQCADEATTYEDESNPAHGCVIPTMLDQFNADALDKLGEMLPAKHQFTHATICTLASALNHSANMSTVEKLIPRAKAALAAISGEKVAGGIKV